MLTEPEVFSDEADEALEGPMGSHVDVHGDTSSNPADSDSNATDSDSDSEHLSHDDDIWEVECIVDKRTDPDLEYLIKWKGWDNEWNQWKKPADMQCEDLIRVYEQATSGTISTKDCEENIVTYIHPSNWLVPYGHGLQNKYCWVYISQRGGLKCCNYR